MSECHHKETDRTFLYIMVFLTMMHTCTLKNADTSKIEDRLAAIEMKVGVDCNSWVHPEL